jgi:PAS domain S-box-containing protein
LRIRVSESASRVRIVVALPGTFAGAPAGDPHGTLEALAQLGPEARLDVVESLGDCAEAAGGADLLVLDGGPPARAEAVLAAARADGVPAVAVIAGGSEADAVEWFRRGAADCVAAGAEGSRALPPVALEQIRRGRELRERRSVARHIADLQRYNENIIQNLNSALLVVDSDGGVTFANGMAAEILGEPEAELRGRSVWDWFSTARGEVALLAQTLSEGARYRGAETVISRADGAVVPIGISCAPLVDADGTQLGAVAIFQDLSEISMLQRQVLQSEKMASIGQLAAGVAHEINNPMGFIHANLFQMAEYLADLRRLWSQVGDLRKAAVGGEPQEIRRAAAAMDDRVRELDAEHVFADFAKAIRESQEGSERIRHIVRDLRDFSYQDDDERVPADINQCLDSTANIVWSMMKHSAVLRKRYADLPRVLCYPMQLKQVFMNLLVNAYQAIEERVGASGECGEIELVTELRCGRVAIAVSDTGVGIPPDKLSRIFDPFFTTKSVGIGMGLGLSTSYNIVCKHGGTLRASNRPGSGATFEVLLPLDPEDAAKAEGKGG